MFGIVTVLVTLKWYRNYKNDTETMHFIDQ